MGFADTFRDLGISPRMRMDVVASKMQAANFGRTDCALPMQYALRNKIDVDHFVVVTDNDTWFGNQHPMQALREYRQARGIPAKLSVLATTASSFTIADPADAGTMDFCGLDAAVPQLLTDFAAGRI
jgi:60 kDa SS-A/Ro ribonucleoprotein